MAGSQRLQLRGSDGFAPSSQTPDYENLIWPTKSGQSLVGEPEYENVTRDQVPVADTGDHLFQDGWNLHSNYRYPYIPFKGQTIFGAASTAAASPSSPDISLPVRLESLSSASLSSYSEQSGLDAPATLA